MDHSQPPTTIITDNFTSAGYINDNIQMKKSKLWDMRLHWLRDRENQKEFTIKWKKGQHNCADYHTKHHSVTHHRTMRLKDIRDSQ